LKFITVVRPHEATNRELMTLYQNIYTMAIFFLLGATAKTMAYLPIPILKCLFHTQLDTHTHTHTPGRTTLISSSQRALHSAEQTQHIPLSVIRTHYLGHQEASA